MAKEESSAGQLLPLLPKGKPPVALATLGLREAGATPEGSCDSGLAT